MPSIGRRVHELRINDRDATWRIVYRTDSDAVIVAEVFAKTTAKTPQSVTVAAKRRLAEYDLAAKGG